MPMFLIDHFPGCTPLTPCASCVAANFLRSKLSPQDIEELLTQVRQARDVQNEYNPLNPAPDDAPVSVLGDLTVRTINCLKNDNVLTIGEIVRRGRDGILRIPNLGRRSLNELLEALTRVGRKLPN